MSSICLYFQVHQPRRIRAYRHFDVGREDYFSESGDSSTNNKKILQKVAQKCYLPSNALFLKLLNTHPEFKLSFSFSGIFLEQMVDYPHVLDSFRKLVDTGRVEILAETYYHSLAFLYSEPEFLRQVSLHEQLIKKLFGVKPQSFRNTELIYNNDIAGVAEKLGYKTILAEGADNVLDWKSPNFVYSPTGTRKIKVLLKNYKLSDDIAFRFSEKSWSDYPLSIEKYAYWIERSLIDTDIINLFMDYETFGEHQWEDTGIFEFLKLLPTAMLDRGIKFVTPSETVSRYESRGKLNVPDFISWADVERDLSAWVGNEMQQDALHKIYALEEEIMLSGDEKLITDWRTLTTSDHFYYMCTKWFADGDVHKYFNPYESPYDAFRYYMNVYTDIVRRLRWQEK